jgi:hypothetical protein
VDVVVLANGGTTVYVDLGMQGNLPEQGRRLTNDLAGPLHGQHARITFLRQVGRHLAVSHLSHAEVQQVSVMAG